MLVWVMAYFGFEVARSDIVLPHHELASQEIVLPSLKQCMMAIIFFSLTGDGKPILHKDIAWQSPNRLYALRIGSYSQEIAASDPLSLLT